MDGCESDYVRSRFEGRLSAADTVTEVAQVLREEMHHLHKAHGQALYQWLERAIAPEVWASIGVLFHPERIPAGLDAYTVFGDGSVRTEQTTEAKVDYYGDVELRVTQGTAVVWDSQRPIEAVERGVVYAMKDAEVVARDDARLDLYDRARAVVYDRAETHARARSFVEVGGGTPSVYADQQAQVYVEAGAPRLFLSECVRALIGRDEACSSPTQVTASGECLIALYGKEDAEEPLLTAEDFKGRLLRFTEGQLPLEVLQGFIVPRCHQTAKAYNEPRGESLMVEPIKQGLLPYLPVWRCDWDAERFERARNEGEVCEVLADYLPEMVDRGLTGALLRDLFTEECLCQHRIYTSFDIDEWLVRREETMRPSFFFGDQLVLGAHYPADKLYAFEQALVVADRPGQLVVVDQTAQAIGCGAGLVEAKGQAEVLGLGESVTLATGSAAVWLAERASCRAGGDARVTAYGSTKVEGLERARVLLEGHNEATVGDQCRVVASPEAQVKADGAAEVAVGYSSERVDGRVECLSAGVRVYRCLSPEEEQRYREELTAPTQQGAHRAAGRGR